MVSLGLVEAVSGKSVFVTQSARLVLSSSVTGPNAALQLIMMSLDGGATVFILNVAETVPVQFGSLATTA
jgi:hypothetical protein